MVQKHADQLEVPDGALVEDDTVALLSHQQTEGKAQVGVDECLPQTLGGLLRITHLGEVGTLEGRGIHYIIITLLLAMTHYNPLHHHNIIITS